MSVLSVFLSNSCVYQTFSRTQDTLTLFIPNSSTGVGRCDWFPTFRQVIDSTDVVSAVDIIHASEHVYMYDTW